MQHGTTERRTTELVARGPVWEYAADHSGLSSRFGYSQSRFGLARFVSAPVIGFRGQKSTQIPPNSGRIRVNPTLNNILKRITHHVSPISVFCFQIPCFSKEIQPNRT